MDFKVTWGVEVLSVVDSNSNSTDVKGPITKVTWRIQNFSTIKDKRHYSEIFVVDDNKWRISLYPKGDNVDYLSIYLQAADSATLPSGWSRYAQFGFAVIDQIDRKDSCTGVSAQDFDGKVVGWGYTSFLALSELHNPRRGYLVNDTCLVESYLSSDRAKALISHELIVKSISVKYEIEDVDGVTNEHEEPNESVSSESGEPTEHDMGTFFSSLESKLLSSNIVVPQYETKEAITKLDEAFNMTPVNSYDSEKISSLMQASMILASSDFSSIMLTIEEKNELFAMEERLIELANRATRAQQGKLYFTEKKWMKLMITGKLDRNLIKYKKIASEVKLMQEKMVALLAELRGIFKSSKEMKTELETLEKECVDYDTKAKIADEEVKIVEAEWRRMKEFISSLGEKIGKPLKKYI